MTSRTKRPLTIFFLGWLGALLASCSPAESPILVATAPAGAPVTAQTLPILDDYWPYRVHLDEPWAPEGEQPIAQQRGLLMRVEDAEHLRVDFGRYGMHSVPVGMTDVLEQTKALRAEGNDGKIDNATRMIGRALGDPRWEPWRAYRRTDAAHRDLLLVGMPLDRALLAQMQEPLSALDATDRVRVVMLFQGEITDQEIFDVLFELGWTMPWLLQRHTRGGTEAYLNEAEGLPWLALVTPNGRLLHQQAWPADGELTRFQRILTAREAHWSAAGTARAGAGDAASS
ncbi:MAG: hypothetical protein AAF430_20180 [Myxococcota bacterium]